MLNSLQISLAVMNAIKIWALADGHVVVLFPNELLVLLFLFCELMLSAGDFLSVLFQLSLESHHGAGMIL